jgi:diaminopimelate decarboxylase
MDDPMSAPMMFLTPPQVQAIQRDYGTPAFVYDEASLLRNASDVLAFPNAYGLTARYAMKACPTAAVVQLLTGAGLHIDASSGYEAERALAAGVPGERIQLTAQELPHDLAPLLDQGVVFNACSLQQLRVYGALRPNTDVCVRINPGLGSGHSNRTNVGGPSSSFGIWHGHVDEVRSVAAEHGLRITGMHTHIGSGSDPEVWNHCAHLALAIVERLPDVETLSLGGGFKVGRMPGEQGADLQAVGALVKRDFEAFAYEHERRLRLEVEPGTYLVANAAALVATVIDIVDTGAEGHSFLKLDTGMTEITRPSLYGAQHPITVVPVMPGERVEKDYLVAGHCCESGDILTPEPGNPEGLAPRRLLEARIGDPVVIGGVGAYCAAMCTKNYNSFPEAPELLLRQDGAVQVIRERQTLDQVLQNERPLTSASTGAQAAH